MVLGQNVPHLMAKALQVPKKDLRFLRTLREDRPDIVISTGSPYAAHAAALSSIPHIAFGDTESASIVTKLMLPFTDAVCTPSSFHGNLGPRHVRYNGYKELAYLHPRHYTPDAKVLGTIGWQEGDQLIVLRLSSLDSSHDINVSGLGLNTEERLRKFVGELSGLGRVLITSERPIPHSLEKYLLRTPVASIHDLLYYATLYIGEGATMASEAGILGTPWIFVSSSGRGFLLDQEQKYGLGFWETSRDSALARARSLFAITGVKEVWRQKRLRLLKEKVDVTDFMVDFIEHWSSGLGHRAREA